MAIAIAQSSIGWPPPSSAAQPSARIPRRAGTGHSFLIVCAPAESDANSRDNVRLTALRSEEKDAKTGRDAPGLAALASAGVLACFAFVFVGGSPSGAHAKRPRGADLTVRSLVAPAVVSGATFRLVFTVANKGDRTARRSKVRAFLSRDTRRGRGDVRLLAAKSIPPLAPGARARETGTARIPRRTGTGHWFLIVCAAAERDANSQNDCRRSSRRTTVWNYPDASNTGPTGLLRESTGNITVSTPGTVIENRKINGCVTFNASNVTIRNSEINCQTVASTRWSGRALRVWWSRTR